MVAGGYDRAPMPGPRPTAVVIGEIDLLRAVARSGVRCVVAARRGDPARSSRFARRSVEWDASEPDTEAHAERLLAIARREPEPPVVFYDGDWDALLLSRDRDRLRPSLRYVIGEAELVETLLAKDRFQTLAEQLELPVPRGLLLSGDDEVPAELPCRFPVVAKPLVRRHATWRPVARAKAAYAESREDLVALWATLREADLPVLVQELVPGGEERIESYHAYVDESGAVAGEFTGRKLRTYPAAFGYSTAVEITAADDVRRLGRSMFERLGLTGVAKLDFKRDDAGGLHLLEVNPRFSLWHLPGAVAGVDLPALVYADLTGEPRPARKAARPGVIWCSPRDLQSARAAGVGALAWGRFALRSEARGLLALDDPLPLVSSLARRALGRSE